MPAFQSSPGRGPASKGPSPPGSQPASSHPTPAASRSPSPAPPAARAGRPRWHWGARPGPAAATGPAPPSPSPGPSTGKVARTTRFPSLHVRGQQQRGKGPGERAAAGSRSASGFASTVPRCQNLYAASPRSYGTVRQAPGQDPGLHSTAALAYVNNGWRPGSQSRHFNMKSRYATAPRSERLKWDRFKETKMLMRR